MSEKMIKVSRYRIGDYTVNYNENGRLLTYRWAGSQPNRIDTKEIPEHVVNWLVMNTNALTNGNLVIEEDEDSKDIIENIDNDDTYKNNIHTRKEIEKLLTGNFTKAKKEELNKITNQAEKDFVINVAQELKIDSVSKREFLADWVDMDVNMLFQDE
jgi:ribosome-interacting GTPase 1